MNEIKITHELCAEDRARIDRLTEALENNNDVHNCEGCVKAVLGMVQAAPATPETAQEPENEPTADEETETPATTPDEEETPDEDEETATEAGDSTEEPAAPVMPVNLYDIQRKVIALSDAGMKAEVKAIVTAYADRVSSLPESCWSEVFERLTALEKTLED